MKDTSASGNDENLPIQPEMELSLEEQDVRTDLDPHLQEMVLAQRSGEQMDPSVAGFSDGGPAMVDVLAELADPAEVVPGLNTVANIGGIVTGTVAIDQIEAVRAHPNVRSLKRATRLFEQLQYSVPEVRGSRQQLQQELPHAPGPVDGSGVIVGVVDYGCDYALKNFRRPDGSSRVLYLWDQRSGETSLSPAPFGYGREFDRAAIDKALTQADPYAALAYRLDRASHGTHVLDIAAGNGRETGVPGMAPGADIIFVEVAAGDYPEDESFGNSRRLLEAVLYVFRKAEELGRPAVVNLSLGTHGGPHDGSTLVEKGLDRLLEIPGRAIVIAAGNSWEQGSHAAGTLQPGQPQSLAWLVSQGDPTPNEMEVWYPGAGMVEVTVVTPAGLRLGPVAGDKTVNITSGGQRVGRIIHRLRDSGNGDNHIDILLHPSLPTGEWKVELGASGGTVPFHAWIERDDHRQSRFAAANDDRSHTLGSISCGSSTVVVGSYDATVPDRALSKFTAEGPTRSGSRKPELSAPGHGVRAASSLGKGGVVAKSGTSMAAPHVAGLVALLFQAVGRPLSIQETRTALTASLRAVEGASGWHGRYGGGRIDAVAALLQVLGAVPTAELAEPAQRQIPPAAGAVEVQGLVTALLNRAVNARIRITLDVDLEAAGRQ